MGDFGNLEADADGKAHKEWTDIYLKMSGNLSIIGRSIVVHEREDDFLSEPEGNSGKIVACGVIGISKTEEASNK